MRFVFDEPKAAQAANYLLTLAGGQMPYIKLIKLLYLADRQALIDRGLTITGDRMVSMDKGPVLSNILDKITWGQPESSETAWANYVSEPEGYFVSAKEKAPELDRLSDYDLGILKAVFERYRYMDRWTLVKITHDLPEWHDPQGSSTAIDPAEILRDAGKSPDEIDEIRDEAEAAFFIRRLPRLVR